MHVAVLQQVSMSCGMFCSDHFFDPLFCGPRVGCRAPASSMSSTPPSPATPPIGVATAEWLEPKAEAGDHDDGDAWYEDTWPMKSEWPKDEAAAGTGAGSTKSEWGREWEEESWNSGSQGYDDQVQFGGGKHAWQWQKQQYKPCKKDGWNKNGGRSTSTSASSGKGGYVRGGFVNGDGKFFECLACSFEKGRFPGLGFISVGLVLGYIRVGFLAWGISGSVSWAAVYQEHVR